MKYLLIILFLYLPLHSNSQNYKYLYPENGLSNRRVYAIKKDHKGYMWFLTQSGIDRYNGKSFKHYKLYNGFEETTPFHSKNWLLSDINGNIYLVCGDGSIFKHDNNIDIFNLLYKTPDSNIGNNSSLETITSCYIDNNNIWLCANDKLYCWNILNEKENIIEHNISSPILCIYPLDDNQIYVGANDGLYLTSLKNNKLTILAYNNIDDNDNTPVTSLYFNPHNNKLIVGTTNMGLCILDTDENFTHAPKSYLGNININLLKHHNDNQLLVSTNGLGIFLLDMESEKITPYIVAEFEKENGMNGNNIIDIYIDDEDRIWMANFPIGITIKDFRFSDYNWIKHSIGNNQSLTNNNVTSILKDSDNELWFTTGNGISLRKKDGTTWKTFFDKIEYNKMPQFLHIAQITDNQFWATGYDSQIYIINKSNYSTNVFPLSKISPLARHDKYIRFVFKDSDGDIWLGCSNSLKKTDKDLKSITNYDIRGVSSIIQKDIDHLWIGTINGLFEFNKRTGAATPIKLNIESPYIYCLSQDNNGTLYIGTSGNGLIIYEPKTKSSTQYYSKNSSLISNSISTILTDENNDYFILGTDMGLSRYFPHEKRFRNWTYDQGLMTIYFNSCSGAYLGNDYYIFGSTNGATEFKLSRVFPESYKTKLTLSDLKIYYENVYPGYENSPLEKNIDDTNELQLNHNQSIFSIEVNSINYAYPSDVLYTWKLEGFYNKWRDLSTNNVIRYNNLKPGKYKLLIRAVSNEDQQVVLEERSLNIIIKNPWWSTIWAYIAYFCILIFIISFIIRFLYLRRQKNISNEKIQFFINSAHDIRTPLTLIKAPLEDIREKELLSQNGLSNMNIALRNVNSLLRLTTNLVNFEKSDVYSSDLHISENELNNYITEIYHSFRSYANTKNITFTYTSNFKFLNVWFDKEKMDSIMKNIISNALKYTPENGEVNIIASENNDSWTIEVKDTGIGIPSSEKKKIFRMHFRASNAINSKITGSGIGLMLVWKLVRLHNGKTVFDSTEGKGTDIKVTIPKSSVALKNAVKITVNNHDSKHEIYEDSGVEYSSVQQTVIEDNQRVLIVEDNNDLRNYLKQTLSETYIVQTCENGKDALTVIKEYKPNLIISDVMMPEMRGDDLCKIIKSNIETSHIPFILLTALNDDNSVMHGINIGADEYITKPFNIGILKATINNILTNRAILQKKYANPDLHEELDETMNLNADIDWKFISTVKKHIEDNIENQLFNIDTLCTLLNMSRTSFYNKLKALTNQAPADYVRVIRLNKAASLLKEGKYSIVEVAEKTGFNDAKYFREVFKKHFKVSPSKYAKGDIDEVKGNDDKTE